MTCTDTSFLISLYGTDVNTPATLQLFRDDSDRLVIHPFVRFEFVNALRHLVFRGKISVSERIEWQSHFESDLGTGHILMVSADANEVLQLAAAMSEKSTETGGHRGFDILLVAAAKILGATRFWSFDERQRKFAAAEGFELSP